MREHRATVNARASYWGVMRCLIHCAGYRFSMGHTPWISRYQMKRRSACYCHQSSTSSTGVESPSTRDDTGIYRGWAKSGSIRRQACATTLFATANSCCSRHRPRQRPNGSKTIHGARWSTPSTLAVCQRRSRRPWHACARPCSARQRWSGPASSPMRPVMSSRAAPSRPRLRSERSRCDAPTQTRSSASH